jgi:hypothetical protein
MTDRTLYGISEIAQAIGVKRQTVSQWHFRGHLPEPDEYLSTGPVWRVHRIRGFIEAKKKEH